jgi:hypothetical protein
VAADSTAAARSGMVTTRERKFVLVALQRFARVPRQRSARIRKNPPHSRQTAQ